MAKQAKIITTVAKHLHFGLFSTKDIVTEVLWFDQMRLCKPKQNLHRQSASCPPSWSQSASTLHGLNVSALPSISPSDIPLWNPPLSHLHLTGVTQSHILASSSLPLASITPGCPGVLSFDHGCNDAFVMINLNLNKNIFLL